ncbi:hypothetical protein [uncultured Oscillibacter sp.]|uniref:hypothetical protein n=1 Tax=uncultured Oscillibacter sp. TaxID=876091 RepID=UPI00262B43FC|nr:hypothetical protein [uncultured Oscillibacter sp.]
MNLMELRVQKVLRENHADFVDSLSLSGIDLERGAWTSDAAEANARAGARSLIHYVSRKRVSARYQQAFLQIIAENLDEVGNTPTMALIYAAYEWDRCFPPYAIIQHMVDPVLFREYCTALQRNLRAYL